jgi:anti-sigma factor ChrR (cupin superfamily)
VGARGRCASRRDGSHPLGRPDEGCLRAIEKFPPGFSSPFHTHSSDLKAVIISGTLIHGPEGKPEVRLSAGSYLFEPSTYRHTTGCDKASECVFFLEGNGKFDIKMVEEKRASAKEWTSSTRHLTEIQSILRR